MSGLVTCHFCDRLYSCHSIHLHEPKCHENPNARRQSVPEAESKLSKAARPRTRSISRSTGVDYRVCFVCGQGFDREDIAKHEKNCLNGWMRECDRLERRFESRTPEPLEIPSIDGTKDLRRLNDHAKDQAARAQLLRCRKCNEKVPLRMADDHRCTRFDPPIEFFF